MATTTKAAAPAKKSGFQGVKAAWIILAICCIAGYSVWLQTFSVQCIREVSL